MVYRWLRLMGETFASPESDILGIGRSAGSPYL